MSSEPQQTPAPHAEKGKASPTVSNAAAKDVESSKKYEQAIFDKPKSFDEIMREKRARQQLDVENSSTETKAADTRDGSATEKGEEPQSKKPKTEKKEPALQSEQLLAPSTSKQVEASAPNPEAASAPTPVPKKPAPSIPKQTKQEHAKKEDVMTQNDTNGKSSAATPQPPPSGIDADAIDDDELAELDALFS